MSLDEQAAEAILDAGVPAGSSKPRMSDYSPTVARLDNIVDRLGDVERAVIATASKSKPRPVPRQPRPPLATDVVKARRSQARHRRLVAQLVPDTDSN